MGGKASVPIKETARQTLSRRGAESAMKVQTRYPAPTPPTAQSPVPAPVAIASQATIATAKATTLEELMDPTILKEMSSWAGNLKSEVDVQALSLRNDEASKTMATVIRFAEEKGQLDRFGKQLKEVSGKLTEEQLMSVYIKAKASVDAGVMAEEFKLPLPVVEALLKAARKPSIVAKANSANQTQLNELVVAV